MALRMPCFPSALPHGFSACGVFLPFLRLFSLRDFFVRASAFFARCVVFCCCGHMLRGLCRFGFLPSDISAEIMAAFLDGRPLPLQRAVSRDFPKGRLLARKRWSFAARKDTFCTLKGYLLESGFSAPRASSHGSRRGRAEPCLGRGTRRA